jgi:hypothetical protein
MEETVLIKENEENESLKNMKNNKKSDKVIINTILPKFEFKNKKGELENPKGKVSY